IPDVARSDNAKILNVMEREYRGAKRFGRFDMKKISPLHTVHPEDRPGIRLTEGNLNIGELDIVDVAQKESTCGNIAEHVGIGIVLIFRGFRRGECSHCFGSQATMLKIDVMDLDVFDRMTGNAGDNSSSAQ